MDDTHENPNAESHERLRRSARDLIDHGVPPPNHSGTLSVEALQLLYQRASKPESAADALKLLHELQTYQVELDLLHEQLQANEHEISEELAYYKSLYELAPAAYLIVANDGEIIEGNQAAGVLFDESAQPLTGKALYALLAPGQESAVNALLRKTKEQDSGKQGAASVSVELPDLRRLTITANSALSGDCVLMILTEATTGSARS
ncbi:PAS domain-containing protein [Marinobacter sp. GN3S48]|uniref:PAS domain-containing protein n=1 Tax=Marinobacter sp. GN3S48 TaxID=3382302 RepID=UPI00387B7E32